MSPDAGLDRMLADVATGLWRLRQRLHDNPRALRDVEALLDRLREDGITVQDHTGDAYDATLSLRVAAFQPCKQVDRVVETLKPTVYYRERRIQIGEVIVGIA